MTQLKLLMLSSSSYLLYVVVKAGKPLTQLKFAAAEQLLLSMLLLKLGKPLKPG
jgi:hypothetical protein